MRGRLPPRRWSFRPSGWIYGLLGLVIGAVLSRPLPLIPMAAGRPVLGEHHLRRAPLPEGLANWHVAGTGPLAHEYLLVTAEPGPAVVLLPALHQVMVAAVPGRSLRLAVVQGTDLPDLPVGVHVHLDYREGDAVEFSVTSTAGGALPVWLYQAARQALLAEAVPIREGLAAEWQRLAGPRGRSGLLPAVTLQAVGLDDIDLLTLGQAAERLLVALAGLPSLPEIRWWAAGRSSSLYLVAGGRYAPGPVLWMVQLTWLIPLVMRVLAGSRRPSPGRRIHLRAEDAAILKAVHDYRLRQGRIPSLAGRRRVERRRQPGGGLVQAMSREAAPGLLTAGGLLLIAGLPQRSLTMAAAGLLAAPVAWLASWLARGEGMEWPERHRGFQALLVLAAITLTGWTGGHPFSLFTLLPAILAWPALAPGGRSRNCLLAGSGAAGAMTVAAMEWPGILGSPAAPALLVVGSLAAVAVRLALATPAEVAGERWHP